MNCKECRFDCGWDGDTCSAFQPKEKPVEIKYNKMEIKNYEDDETFTLGEPDYIEGIKMKNKVIFESEEELVKFYNLFIGCNPTYEQFVLTAKQTGVYIPQSAIEGAEEIVNNCPVSEIMQDENKVRILSD
jgi:hypothetical protein